MLQSLKSRYLLTVFFLVIGLFPSASFSAFTLDKVNLLPIEEAFSVDVSSQNGLIVVDWSIAEDYYMYSSNFDVSTTSKNSHLGELNLPKGKIEDDPEFGKVVVHFQNAKLTLPILSSSESAINLIVSGQGCNKPVGVCYPPINKTVSVDISALALPSLEDASAQEHVNEIDSDGSYWGYLLAALGAGILLSFTPCVLPMVPILAGIITGQEKTTRLGSGLLAIFYVLGTVATYAAAGAFAGLTGDQFQAYFQKPWVIFIISGILIALAVSLFGGFKIQLPSSIQTKLNGSSLSNKSAYFGSFSLGLLSALVVGACVSPILILTLGVAITKGDPILGALIMSMMALGMGVILILFGFGAGWLLPKTGKWMTSIQVVFGFLVLSVPIYLLGSLPQIETLALWAGLLLFAAVYLLHSLQGMTHSVVKSALMTISAVSIFWSLLLFTGAAIGDGELVRPLKGLQAQNLVLNAVNSTSKAHFKTVTTLEELKVFETLAIESKKPLLIDFYADWCLDCRRMDKSTFQEPEVSKALEGWILVKADLTDTDHSASLIKKKFGVFGPPALLFFDSSGKEEKALRNYGFMDKNTFLAAIETI